MTEPAAEQEPGTSRHDDAALSIVDAAFKERLAAARAALEAAYDAGVRDERERWQRKIEAAIEANCKSIRRDGIIANLRAAVAFDHAHVYERVLLAILEPGDETT
jgi:hypothetical protein